jgi:hypothetical protein
MSAEVAGGVDIARLTASDADESGINTRLPQAADLCLRPPVHSISHHSAIGNFGGMEPRQVTTSSCLQADGTLSARDGEWLAL